MLLLDEPFIEEPRRGLGTVALGMLGYGARYVGIMLLSLLTLLPLRLLTFLAFILVITETAMAWTYFEYRHDPVHAGLCLLMVPTVMMAIGLLRRCHVWVMVARLRWL